jgi:hypothetical protein
MTSSPHDRPIDRLLTRLESAGCQPRPKGASRWSAWCPGHSGTHRDGLSVCEADDGKVLVHCYAGCSAQRVAEALDLAVRDLFPEGSAIRSRTDRAASRPPEEPSGLDLTDAQSLVEAAAGAIWTLKGAQALEYLRSRGLADHTIRQARLGWTPGVGIPIQDGTRYWRVEGIVLPWFDGDRLALVRIRRPEGLEPRYVQAYGNRPRVYPSLAAIRSGIPVIVAEGEFDTLLLSQALEGFASVIAFPGITSRPDSAVLRRMWTAGSWYVATDDDSGGNNAAREWLDTRARRVRPPLKDWGKSYAAGVDLRHFWEDRLVLEQFLVRLQLQGICLDGRLVHPQIGVGPVTGRVTYTGTDPPLQGLPKADRPARLRPVVEGRVFVRADCGQIEPRILHAILRQRGLIDWEPGPDLYLTLGGEGCDRDAIKTAVNAAINGGRRPEGATGRLVEFLEAADVYSAELARQARVDGFIRTLAGQFIALASDEPNHSGKAVNRVVQGTAADIFIRATLAVARTLEAQGLPATVAFLLHDELWVETDPAALVRVAALVRQEMEAAAVALGVEVPVRLDDASQAAWEAASERAGIMEYDGGLSRGAAEKKTGLR